MKVYYSASENLFYLGEWLIDYCSVPDDIKEVDEVVFHEFTAANNKAMRIAGDDGLPKWSPLPEPTTEEINFLAEQERNRLIENADSVTADWRVELLLGVISEENKAKLKQWMIYKDLLKSIDTSSSLDIKWPDAPV